MQIDFVKGHCGWDALTLAYAVERVRPMEKV